MKRRREKQDVSADAAFGSNYSQTEPVSVDSFRGKDASRHELSAHAAEPGQPNQELCEEAQGLADALNLFEGVFENSPLGYVILDREGLIVRANRRFKKLFPSVRTFEGVSFPDFFISKDVTAFKAEADLLDKTPQDAVRSVILQCAPHDNQHAQWLKVSLSRLQLDERAFDLASAEMINERMQREQDLLRANRLLEHEIEESREAQVLLEQSRRQTQDMLEYYLTILEDFPALTWRANKEGSRDYFNRTWLEFTGSVLSNEVDGGWLDSVHPDDLTLSQAIIEESIRQRHPFEFSYRLMRADGEWRWITDLGRPFRGPKGEYAGYIGCCIDITARINQQRAMEDAKARAEAADSAKSEFLANISHEVRTPLNGIMGMLDALADSNPTQEQAGYMETAAYSARQLLGVLNDLLDLARIEAGNLQVQMSSIVPGELVRKAVEVYALEAAGLGLEILPEIDPGLDHASLSLDEVRVRQLLFNLMGNAFKFTSVGGTVGLTSFLAGPSGNKRLVLIVSDTGIGIAPDKLSTIFEPFVQAEGSLTRRFGGAGLGLSIVKKLVHMMNGSVCVSSEVGDGSEFAISIPVADACPVKPLGISEETDDHPLPPMRALVVEDDAVNRITAKRMLEKLGMEVHVALDGRQALETLAGGDFDIVFMDIQMPVMDGLSATIAIRALEATAPVKKRMPIVAMTAHAMKGDREMCLSAGMDEYVAKPLEKAALLLAVRNTLLARSRLQ